jgi:hypothetical protein
MNGSGSRLEPERRLTGLSALAVINCRTQISRAGEKNLANRDASTCMRKILGLVSLAYLNSSSQELDVQIPTVQATRAAGLINRLPNTAMVIPFACMLSTFCVSIYFRM